jgi:hypothetical protein
MKDLLREHLDPKDDGSAFTGAVLFRAAGALHRRRAAGASEDAPVLGWLERWARPWVIASLVALAVLVIMPALPRQSLPPSGTHALSADAVTALLPQDVAAAVVEY